MKFVKFSLLITVGLVLLVATPAQTQFVKTLGGMYHDCGYCVVEASDGGLVVTGWTESFGAGDRDFLLAKFDTCGNHLWTRILGGVGVDYGYSVIQASDGGLVGTGFTESFGAGSSDLLLAKFDASGNHLWTRTLGGTSSEQGNCVIEASDGGLVVTGYTTSFGAGSGDLLLTKFDASGNHLWTRTLGAIKGDIGQSVIQASDGALVVAGYTQNFGAGYTEWMVAKFDSSGNHLWTRTLGGNGEERGLSVTQVSDGGVLVTGWSGSFGAWDCDLLLAKFDASGNHLWTRSLGTNLGDYRGQSVIQASDGGLVVTGWAESFGADSPDLVLSKFDAFGNPLWTRTLGAIDWDEGRSVIEASDGQLVVTGHTQNFGAGYYHDLLLAKFDASGNTCLAQSVSPEFDTVYPTIDTAIWEANEVSPDTASWAPTITEPTPETTTVCDVVTRILSITDVGNDQGKQIRVKWAGNSYDTEGSIVTITEYGLWRRIDEDKGHNLSKEILSSNSGMSVSGRLYPPGEWDFIKTVPAIGEEEYNTVCPTLGDSTLAEGMYWSVFFVIAHTQEPPVHYDSDPDSGYSLDNIPPLPILDLGIDPGSWLTLEWIVPGEYVGEQPITSYDIRYNTIPVGADTQAWWDSAETCAGEGFFNFIVGNTDSLKVATQTWCHPDCYFAIKGLDSRPNASKISNMVHFICGDVTSNEVVDIGDVVKLINYLYRGGDAPEPVAVGDATCDGVVDLGDVVCLINYLYKNGDPPCSP